MQIFSFKKMSRRFNNHSTFNKLQFFCQLFQGFGFKGLKQLMLVCTQAGEFFKACDFLLNESQLMIQCTKKKKKPLCASIQLVRVSSQKGREEKNCAIASQWHEITCFKNTWDIFSFIYSALMGRNTPLFKCKLHFDLNCTSVTF